jgi:hypothetical protein
MLKSNSGMNKTKLLIRTPLQVPVHMRLLSVQVFGSVFRCARRTKCEGRVWTFGAAVPLEAKQRETIQRPLVKRL